MTASGSLTRRIANPLMRVVLSSPAHVSVSRSVLLLSYTGRNSGRRRSIPVQYARFGEGLVLVAVRAAQKSWWRNFLDPAAVTITLRGHPRGGVAEILRGDERDDGCAAFTARFPRAQLGEDFEIVRVRLDVATGIDDEARRQERSESPEATADEVRRASQIGSVREQQETPT